MNQPASLEAIYSEYYTRIHRYLSRLIGPDDADDVSQEVFLKVGRALAEFKGESSLSTWIYRIATNAATDRTRTAAYRAGLAAAPLDESCEAAAPALPAEEQAIRGEMSECVQGFLKELPDTLRAVLVLSDMEGLRNREIAEVLGLTLDTVKIRLHRGRARFRQMLQERCDFSHDSRNTLVCDIKR